MVLDKNILQEKLIEAWRVRKDEASFSASLLPLVAQCESHEEFRTLFTKHTLEHINSATSSDLLQSYFKFHARSGYINETLVIERLLSLKPSVTLITEDAEIKFLLELLLCTLKNTHITAEQARSLGKQVNLLAKWLLSALCIHSDIEMTLSCREMLDIASNLFLLILTNTTYCNLWLMTIKAQNEQAEWKQLIEKLIEVLQTIPCEEPLTSNSYRQILSKINDFDVSKEFYKETIELNPSILNSIIPLVVTNQLHRSSSVILTAIRCYEHVSMTSNPSLLYLRLLQVSFGGYVASISTNNGEYQQRWSSFVFFQLPRLLASCIETQFEHVMQALEDFSLYNEYLLNRLDELLLRNVLVHLLQTTLNYIPNMTQENADLFHRFIISVENSRAAYIKNVQEHHSHQATDSYSKQIFELQYSLEQALHNIFSANKSDEHLQLLINNLTNFIPLICATDQYYRFILLLLSYIETQYDLVILLLCYTTLITDDASEDFGHLELNCDRSSSEFIVYVWLKKYWLSRSAGHALFSSSLDSIDLISTTNNSIGDTTAIDHDEFLNEIKASAINGSIQKTYSNIECLTKTIYLLGEISSLSFDETKKTISALIVYLTNVSYGSLVHVLLWLIANYEIATEDRIWIRQTIDNMGALIDSTTITYSLFDALRHQLCSDIIENPLEPYHARFFPKTPSTLAINCASMYSQTATALVLNIFDTYLTDEHIDSEQSRCLFICSKHVPMNSILTRLLLNTNASTGISVTCRALDFIFSFILIRRRSSTRCLLQQVLPYLINMKSNEFMLEPSVNNMCVLSSMLLVLELNTAKDELGNSFHIKSWKPICQSLGAFQINIIGGCIDPILPNYEDTSVVDAYHKFLDWSSNELFSTDNIRPVNYFIGWLQTVLWMFSRSMTPLKAFNKPKLITQLSEYLSIQYPIRKVLTMLDLANDTELHYASMVITQDFSHLQTSRKRRTINATNDSQVIDDEPHTTTPVNITKNVYTTSRNL